MSLCDRCRFRLNTWSEELRIDYNGCGILLNPDKIVQKILNYNDEKLLTDYLFSIIDIDQISFGWVTDGKMAINDQLIVKDVNDCKKFLMR